VNSSADRANAVRSAAFGTCEADFDSGSLTLSLTPPPFRVQIDNTGRATVRR
jgi:hypothetical protein